MKSVRREPGKSALVLLVASALTALMVMAPGGAAIAASTKWAIQASPNHTVPGGQIGSVSCGSADACTAVGNYVNTSGIIDPLAETWNGQAWHKDAIPIPPGDTVPAVEPDLTGVSCPSADFCEAVGGYQSGTTGIILAETWDGTSWALQSVPAPAGSTSATLQQVSCPSATFCEAVGSYASASNVANPFAEMWNGTAWTPQSTPSPADATISILDSLSCASATFCETEGGGSTSFADAWNGTSWQLQSLPANVSLGLLSCPSADFCESVSGSVGAVWNGTTWSPQTFPVRTGYVTGLAAVSCLSATFCEAVGSYYSGSSGPYYALAAAWNGTAWTLHSARSPAGAYQTNFDQLSCVADDACEAVGNYEQTAQSQPETALAEGWNGHSWTIQHPAKPAGAMPNSLNAVSCTSASFCEAVGIATDTSGYTISLAEQWNGTAWTIQATPDPAEEISGARAAMHGVSCVSATFCEAVGSSSVNPGAAAWVWNGTSWTAQTIAGSSYLTSVSCPSADFCVAVSDDGDVNMWNGASWSAQSATAAGFSLLYSVSCSSADFCEAVGYDSSSDSAETWNGSTWTAQPTPTPAGGSSLDLNGVSCVTADRCETVGTYFSSSPFAQLTVAEKWNGTAWAVQTTPNPANSTDNSLLGVWCTSAKSCTSVGFTEPNIINKTLAEVWNGTAWRLQSTPNKASASNNVLNGVSCGAVGGCTAIGATTDRGSIPANLVETGD
jgi:hypothetical protein